MVLFLLLAINFNGLADKGGSTLPMLIDIIFETLIRYIHLPQAFQDLLCATIVIAGNMLLQRFYKVLRGIGSCRFSVFHVLCKRSHDLIHTVRKGIPLFFRVVFCFFRMLFVRIGSAPFFFCFGLVLFMIKTEMFDLLVKQLAEKEGITEQIKATVQMAWVGAMNNIRRTAEEVIVLELIIL